ncbi:hypothetical protein F4779DRAFT_632326 [Xylariaceae sp. FL0662B]|nr:hypothetical protein F4779DRAFT_632326 [Xylariaceae sp. FL0662B]
MSLAIATTVLSPASNFVAWLDFHLRRCALILIYLDDPGKHALFEQLCGNRPVNIFDGATDGPAMSRPNRLLLRQSSNLKHAISHLLDQRLELGVEWLLHIDQDEILFENGERLPDKRTLAWATIFADHVWFNTNGPLAEPFIAYGNGKSAARLSSKAEPDGAHRFKLYEGDAVTLPDIGSGAASGAGGLGLSWRAKLCLYGEFSDFWLDDKKYPNKGGDLTGPWAEARQFFATRIFSGESLESRVRDGKAAYYAPFGGPQLGL